jgi:hypothetical protein
MQQSRWEITRMPLKYSRRAQNGAYILDLVEGGPEWRNNIDRQKLDVYSETSCPLGQLYGSFDEGVRRILEWYKETYPESYQDGNDDPEAISIYEWLTDRGFAFFIDPDTHDGKYTYPRTSALRKRYDQLTQAWRKVIDAYVESGPDPAVQKAPTW